MKFSVASPGRTAMQQNGKSTAGYAKNLVRASALILLWFLENKPFTVMLPEQNTAVPEESILLLNLFVHSKKGIMRLM